MNAVKFNNTIQTNLANIEKMSEKFQKENEETIKFLMRNEVPFTFNTYENKIEVVGILVDEIVHHYRDNFLNNMNIFGNLNLDISIVGSDFLHNTTISGTLNLQRVGNLDLDFLYGCNIGKNIIINGAVIGNPYKR